MLDHSPSPLSQTNLRPLLSLTCAFTALCGLWLGAMDVVLHHQNIAGHELIAGTIVLQAALTLAAIARRSQPVLLPLAGLGCFALLGLCTLALHGLFTSPHFEGYILLIALALLFQACLTLLFFAQDATFRKHGPLM